MALRVKSGAFNICLKVSCRSFVFALRHKSLTQSQTALAYTADSMHSYSLQSQTLLLEVNNIPAAQLLQILEVELKRQSAAFCNCNHITNL